MIFHSNSSKNGIGLCNDNINQTKGDMPPPTPADLQGFWEMVLLQVDNVDSLYADIDKMRANGWKVMITVNIRLIYFFSSCSIKSISFSIN